MTGKMKMSESSYISPPAIFPFNKPVLVAIVINSASFEVWFAANTWFGVTKQHQFVTNKHCFVTNKVYFVTNKVCFVTNKVYFVTNKVCFVTNKHCFASNQCCLAAKQHSFLTKKLCFVQNSPQTSTVKSTGDVSRPQNTSEFL